jgi:subtilisin-like proprotein convertase family protein
MRYFLYAILSVFLLGLLPQLTQAQDPCECLNCPLFIPNNSTQSSYLNVEVDGPNDLGQCQLEAVCFEIQHTWVGDLSVTLTSPSGLNYLVMADIDNDSLGCGNENNNINICITPGTSNPITNNTEYVCNGGPFDCLNGDWTMPCGGVFDPISGAVQAPNCDLDDFNVPGDPVNGIWALTINDICPLDVGTLLNWSLEFSCPPDCNDCFADGGSLGNMGVEACEGSPDLILSFMPEYNAVDPPDSTLFGYTFIISQNDTILEVDTLPDLSAYPPGDYMVCGFSYDLDEVDSLLNLPGATLMDADTLLLECGDLSDSCATVTVFAIPPVTMLDTTLCANTCFTAPDGTVCCDPGICEYTLLNVQGCDSVIQVNITILPPNEVSLDEYVCEGDCVTVGGVVYCPPGPHNIVLTDQNGCDSTITLNLIELNSEAAIDPPGTLSCDQDSVVLYGGNSTGLVYEWTDAGGTVVGSEDSLVVNAAGCYTLTVADTTGGLFCASDSTVCVIDVSFIPNDPVFLNPEPAACEGDTSLFQLQADPLADNHVWNLPPNAQILSGGDGFDFVEIIWTAPGVGYRLCYRRKWMWR